MSAVKPVDPVNPVNPVNALNASIEGFPIAHWNERGVTAWALAPLAALFRVVVAMRRLAYRISLATPVRLSVPTIVVGNFTVGGAGKTPLTIALVDALRARGWQPGVVSCGYGGSGRGVRAVGPTSDPRIDGDEPVLIARRTGVPGYVGADRSAAALALLREHPTVNVLLCDDGLQHLRLGRDIEIAVVDRRGYGNGMLLPAGPLRELPRPVDALVRNGDAPPEALPEGEFAMTLDPDQFTLVHEPSIRIDRAMLNGRRLHAVAGIGSPARFFDTLRALGLHFAEHPFPDHHAYIERDLAFADCDYILMTEKDAVKCAQFGRRDLISLAVSARIDERLIALVLDRLQRIVTATA